MQYWAIGVFVAALGAMGCQRGENVQPCEVEADCEDGLVCVGDVCGTDPYGPCILDGEEALGCGEPWVCMPLSFSEQALDGGVCLDGCRSDTDCPEASYDFEARPECFRSDPDAENGVCVVRCTTDEDCWFGAVVLEDLSMKSRCSPDRGICGWANES